MKKRIQNWKDSLTIAKAIRQGKKVIQHEDGSVEIIINRYVWE